MRLRSARVRDDLIGAQGEVLDEAVGLCGSLLRDLARERLEFDARIERLAGAAARAADVWGRLFDEMPLAGLETDAGGLVLRANEPAAMMLNVSVSYLQGRPIRSFSAHGGELEQLLRMLVRQDDTCHRASIAIRPHGGAPFRADVTIVPCGGYTDGWVWLFEMPHL